MTSTNTRPSPHAARESAAVLRAWLAAVQAPPAVLACVDAIAAQPLALPDPEPATGMGPHAPSDECDYGALDPGIRRYVRVLRGCGVETFESCQGGDGHASPEPLVRFHGDMHAGYEAFAHAMRHGLPVLSLRHAHYEQDSKLTGPWWEMTFRACDDTDMRVTSSGAALVGDYSRAMAALAEATAEVARLTAERDRWLGRATDLERYMGAASRERHLVGKLCEAIDACEAGLVDDVERRWEIVLAARAALRADAGQAAPVAVEPNAWQERAESLWQLLDNIDTLDDACRYDDAGFRFGTRSRVAKRFAVLESDGYSLFVPGSKPAPAPPPSAPTPSAAGERALESVTKRELRKRVLMLEIALRGVLDNRDNACASPEGAERFGEAVTRAIGALGDEHRMPPAAPTEPPEPKQPGELQPAPLSPLSPEAVARRRDELARGISSAINCVSAENASNTPDFILASFLVSCLDAWDACFAARAGWYGTPPNGPGERPANPVPPSAPAADPVAEPRCARCGKPRGSCDYGTAAPHAFVPSAEPAP